MHGVLLWGENAWTWNNGAIKLESVQINNLVTWQVSWAKDPKGKFVFQELHKAIYEKS